MNDHSSSFISFALTPVLGTRSPRLDVDSITSAGLEPLANTTADTVLYRTVSAVVLNLSRPSRFCAPMRASSGTRRVPIGTAQSSLAT